MKIKAQPMNFPSIFLCKAEEIKSLPESHEMLSLGAFCLAYRKDLVEKVLIINTSHYTVFGHLNMSCRKKLIALGNDIEELVTNHSSIAADLHWGFLAFIEKNGQKLIIINDIYGIYPLYYTKQETDVTISNDFENLAKMQNSLTINEYGVYDYLLFNYTLKSRTLFKEIFQLEGGSRLTCDKAGFNVETVLDVATMITASDSKEEIAKMCDALMNNIENDLDSNLPTRLPLTGGFDSKVIISLLLSKDVNFSSFTFGTKGSPDHVAAVSISEKFNVEHEFIGMGEKYILDLKAHIDLFMRNHPNAPMFDTLLNYLLIGETLPSSNLVTGKMGGELIVGPVLVSELITTRSFALLSLCKKKQDLFLGLTRHAKETGFVNVHKFKEHVDEYASPFLDYMKKPNDKDNINIVTFLLKETYPKFFGVVFSNLFGKFNIINPFVDIKFLKILLNSKYKFTNKKPFSKNPIPHFFSRQLYPLLIKKLYPPVLKTRMDRGYNLEDFLPWHNILKPFLNYVRRHFLSQKKKAAKPSVDYMDVIKHLAVDMLPSSCIVDLEVFDKNKLLYLLDEMSNKRTSKFQEQKLVQLLTLHFFVLRYSDKIKNHKFNLTKTPCSARVGCLQVKS